MAHLIDFSNARANMAYVGEKPWHGLGFDMQDDASLDQWRIAAGLGFEVKSSNVMFHNGRHFAKGEGKVLFRDDTLQQLSVVTDRYKVVQPKEVVDFYRDLTEQHGFKMETMGALSGGKRIWALAKCGEGFTVGNHDRIENYLLLATSYDKSLATRAQFTTVRVVCQNTLSMAVASKKSCVTVSHAGQFDASKVKLDLGIMTDGNATMSDAFAAMAQRKVTDKEAVRWIAKVLFDLETEQQLADINTRKDNIIKGVFGLYKGNGMGSNLETANGTAFGLMNAITEQVDHHQGRNVNNRMAAAWFGVGENLKAKAYEQALSMAS